MANVQTETKRSRRTGRAPGAWSIIIAEYWERFSFYGLQAILAFYLLYSLSDGGLDLGPTLAVGIVGAYGGSVYLFQAVGAWVGERALSPRNATLVGGILIMAGHVSLALVPGVPGLAVGLSTIVVGSGLVKTNIALILGMSYDGRPVTERDAGFSLFWMSIQFGAVLGPILTGFVQSRMGFHLAFGLAAIGMFFGLIQYLIGYRRFPAEAGTVIRPLSARDLGIGIVAMLAAALVVAVSLWTGVINAENLNMSVGVLLVVIAAITFALMARSKKTTGVERTRLRAYIPLWFAEALYFGFLLQIFTTIPVFVSERVDRFVLGWERSRRHGSRPSRA